MLPTKTPSMRSTPASAIAARAASPARSFKADAQNRNGLHNGEGPSLPAWPFWGRVTLQSYQIGRRAWYKRPEIELKEDG
jgi:hypothetical protein